MSKQNHTNYNLSKIQQVIDEGKQPLYELFNNEKVGNILSDITLENTPFRGRVSEKSLRIKLVDKGQDLACIFGLDHRTFGEKYLQAISGDGQEARRIRTLHSSSLLALLCFYGVSEKRPLMLGIDGRTVKFTASAFEVKNYVGTDETGKSHDSNIDVVLTGKDVASEKIIILFLESKFSEYLTWGKYSNISNHVYEDIYDQLKKGQYLERMGLKFEASPVNTGYSDLYSIKGNSLHYAGGIKQMISHFLGVKNASDDKAYKHCDIYLGEILYRFPDSIDAEGYKFHDYNQIYGILTEGLNRLSESKFKVLNHCLTYQEVFKNYEMEDAIRTFYSL